MRMVRFADIRNFLAASCCNVLVVNGGFGFDVRGFSSIFITCHDPLSNSLTSFLAFASDRSKTVSFFNFPVFESKSLLDAIRLSSMECNVALKLESSPFFARSACKLKYVVLRNFARNLS